MHSFIHIHIYIYMYTSRHAEREREIEIEIEIEIEGVILEHLEHTQLYVNCLTVLRWREEQSVDELEVKAHVICVHS
jgi:hypothetical protein